MNVIAPSATPKRAATMASDRPSACFLRRPTAPAIRTRPAPRTNVPMTRTLISVPPMVSLPPTNTAAAPNTASQMLANRVRMRLRTDVAVAANLPSASTSGLVSSATDDRQGLRNMSGRVTHHKWTVAPPATTMCAIHPCCFAPAHMEEARARRRSCSHWTLRRSEHESCRDNVRPAGTMMQLPATDRATSLESR